MKTLCERNEIKLTVADVLYPMKHPEINVQIYTERDHPEGKPLLDVPANCIIPSFHSPNGNGLEYLDRKLTSYHIISEGPTLQLFIE
jgi:hypothetical protein